jgi:hypothetical protein
LTIHSVSEELTRNSFPSSQSPLLEVHVIQYVPVACFMQSEKNHINQKCSLWINLDEGNLAGGRDDVKNALKTSGENVTLDAGYFIFPTWMAPKPPDIWMNACIVIKGVTTCGGYTQPANNPELVYMDMRMPYHNVIDYYWDLDQHVELYR